MPKRENVMGFFSSLFGKKKRSEDTSPVVTKPPKKYESPPTFKINKKFATKVRGVTHKNLDGTDRQKIIRKCKKGEKVVLIREPDNPYDVATIAVFRKSGEQIGNISKDVAFGHPAFPGITYDMDNGAQVSAKIIDILGGGSLNYGCVIEVAVGNIPWREKEEEAKNLITEAKSLEDTDPNISIELYNKSINELLKVEELYQNTLFYKRTGVELDCMSPNAVLRSTKLPINRLSLVLEKNKKYKECLELIEKYEKMEDPLGLTKGDMENIRKRKNRVIKKLS